jgi:hypothetical protein
MRTTITLEPAAEAYVRNLMRERGLTFKQAVNKAILDGAEAPEGRKQFSTPTYDMGKARIDITKALQIAGELENQEIIRKMQMGK